MKIYRLTLQSLQDTEMNSNAQSTPVILDITSHLTSFFLFLIFKSTLLSSVAASLLMRPETSEQLKLIRVDPDLLPVVSLYWAKTDQSSLKSFKSVYSCFFFSFCRTVNSGRSSWVEFRVFSPSTFLSFILLRKGEACRSRRVVSLQKEHSAELPSILFP